MGEFHTVSDFAGRGLHSLNMTVTFFWMLLPGSLPGNVIPGDVSVQQTDTSYGVGSVMTRTQTKVGAPK